MNKHFINTPVNIESLFSLVKLECELIKKHFTSEEINKLELDIIDPTSTTACLYGHMVGDCNNIRVNRFIEQNLNTLIKSGNYSKLETDFDSDDRSFYYMTPLEEYIYDYSLDFDDDNNTILTEEVKNRIQKVLNLLKN